jgi:hypothetical protein
MIAILIVCLWVLVAPLGYLASRWSGRVMGDRWTRNDRLYAIVASVLYGPLMPALAVVLILLWKLATSKWGNQDARW